MTMGDTKNGREQNGKNKRSQQMRRHIEMELTAEEEPPERSDAPEVLDLED